jgi:ribose transport system permease protein
VDRDGVPRAALRVAERYAIVVALLTMIALFTIIVPGGTFATQSNFVQMAATVPAAMLVALGLTITLASGDFDLSVGAAMGISAATFVKLNVQDHRSLAQSLAVVAGLALAIGIANGVLVVFVGLNALIATLATGTVLGGLSLAILNNETVPGVSQSLQDAMLSDVYGTPTPFVIACGTAIVLWYMHELTPLGRRITMVGEGREAARLMGIRVNRLRFGSFVAAAILSALAGIILVGQIGAADPNTGPDYVLPAFAAAFLGATTIRVGRFNPLGTVVAIFLVQVGVTGLQQLGLQSWVVQVFNGTALLVAVLFAKLVATSKWRRRARRPESSQLDEALPAVGAVPTAERETQL